MLPSNPPSNMLDPFATLPGPLPILIMEAIDDLPTLHNYYFEQYYVEVTEAILSNYAPELQLLLRAMILCRSNASGGRHKLPSPKILGNFLMSYLLRPSAWSNAVGINSLSKETTSPQALRGHITSAPVIRQASSWYFRCKGLEP